MIDGEEKCEDFSNIDRDIFGGEEVVWYFFSLEASFSVDDEDSSVAVVVRVSVKFGADVQSHVLRGKPFCYSPEVGVVFVNTQPFFQLVS